MNTTTIDHTTLRQTFITTLNLAHTYDNLLHTLFATYHNTNPTTQQNIILDIITTPAAAALFDPNHATTDPTDLSITLDHHLSPGQPPKNYTDRIKHHFHIINTCIHTLDQNPNDPPPQQILDYINHYTEHFATCNAALADIIAHATTPTT